MGFLLEQVNKVLFPFLFKEKILFFFFKGSLKAMLAECTNALENSFTLSSCSGWP